MLDLAILFGNKFYVFYRIIAAIKKILVIFNKLYSSTNLRVDRFWDFRGQAPSVVEWQFTKNETKKKRFLPEENV